jgi:hypothetical protein
LGLADLQSSSDWFGSLVRPKNRKLLSAKLIYFFGLVCNPVNNFPRTPENTEAWNARGLVCAFDHSETTAANVSYTMRYRALVTVLVVQHPAYKLVPLLEGGMFRRLRREMLIDRIYRESTGRKMSFVIKRILLPRRKAKPKAT